MGNIDERAARRMIYAITIQAFKDHRRGNGEATAWLERDAVDWLTATGMDVNDHDVQRALSSNVQLIRDGRNW